MKKNIFLFSCFLLLAISQSFGQAKKPTIMILPSDVWCNLNGYMTELDNQGTKTKIPNYKKAFQENPQLLLAINKINNLMADRGFPLKDAEAALRTLESEAAEDNLLVSKNSGAGISENAIDKLKKVAKADIVIYLTWTVNATGPKKTITYNLKGLDAYTDKQVAGADGTGAPSFAAEIDVLLGEAVLANMDAFTTRLQTHFDDLLKNGREVIVRVKVFGSDWDGDLEKEYDGKELREIIQDWMNKATVQGRNSLTDDTENMMLFEQVRIPMFDEKGTALDAKSFVRGLQKFLNAPPYSITNKLMTKGLGQASVVLGSK